MSQTVVVAGFAEEAHLRRAVGAVRQRGWTVLDVYAPYALHDLERLLGWRRSRLPVVCFSGGVAGLTAAFWFQFWASVRSWPLNVGGRPWNSLPAFVPVAFESMVLLAGFSVVFGVLLRCRRYPGKQPRRPSPGVTDDRFALVLQAPSDAVEEVRRVFHECQAVGVDAPREEVRP